MTEFLSSVQIAAIHACTDITGFGLAGHGMQLAQASQVSLTFHHSALPCFKFTRLALANNYLTKAHLSNRQYTQSYLDLNGLEENEANIYFDPQTSGGLLLSVDSSYAESIVHSLAAYFPQVCCIGRVEVEGASRVRVAR